MIKLLGIVVIAVGFALRWNALLVVVSAGVATGLLAGFSPREIAEMLGRFFVDNRALTLPVVLMVPVVGLLERHGLQERVAALIRGVRAATAGRVIWLYQLIRQLTSMVGMNIGNHASMVRPLVAPMAEAAAAQAGHTGAEARELVRAHAAAGENVGNFFADDIFVAVGALLVVQKTLESAGAPVALTAVQWWSAPTAVVALGVGWWRFRRLDRRLRGTGPAEGGTRR